MARSATERFLRRLGAASAVCALLLGACVAASAGDPATENLRHGARSKAADGTLVVWDKVNGVYLVPGHNDFYWVTDRFYQYDHGVWTVAPAIAGPWELIAEHLVPTVALGRYSLPKASVTAKLPSGREAVYEPRLKVYKVAGRRGVFLFDAAYYRYDDGVWLESKTDDGPWKPTSPKILPPPLRKAVPQPEEGQAVTLPSGETVVYSAEGRMFALKDKPSVVFFDGSFFEKRDTKWFSSQGSTAAFAEVAMSQVPQPVRAKFPKAGAAGKVKHDKPEKRDKAKKQKKQKRDKAAGKMEKTGKAGGANKKTTRTDSE